MIHGQRLNLTNALMEKNTSKKKKKNKRREAIPLKCRTIKNKQ